MIRSKLPKVLVLSGLAILLAVAQPAAAISSDARVELGAGLWTGVRALFDDVLVSIGWGLPTSERPGSVTANAGSVLTPDGLPNGVGTGTANAPLNESH